MDFDDGVGDATAFCVFRVVENLEQVVVCFHTEEPRGFHVEGHESTVSQFLGVAVFASLLLLCLLACESCGVGRADTVHRCEVEVACGVRHREVQDSCAVRRHDHLQVGVDLGVVGLGSIVQVHDGAVLEDGLFLGVELECGGHDLLADVVAGGQRSVFVFPAIQKMGWFGN